MTNSLTWRERWALRFRMNLMHRLHQRSIRDSPAAFRTVVHLPGVDAPFQSLVQPWQQTDFRALDPAWQLLAGVRTRRVSESDALTTPIRRAWIERPRGHSKTSDMALQLAWILLFSKRPLRGLAAAADRDQASLLTNALKDLANANPELCGELSFQKHRVVSRESGCELDVISSDVSSSWGLLPDFVICDELCHWEQSDLWYSLLSSAAKKSRCVLGVLTNAGVGRGWQWDVREAARTSPEWHFSSLDGPQAPWLDPAALIEQQTLLPRPIYDRLWNNIWQHSDGEFVSLSEAEACADESLKIVERAQPRSRYVAAIDYAEKHDLTVGVLMHDDGSRVVIDRLDVAAPTPESPVPVRWVEEWMTQIADRFPATTFILDPYQLIGLIQKYEAIHDVRRFEFGGGKGNHALAVNLRRLIIERRIAWPPDIGQRPDRAHRDTLETELASLLLKHRTNGLVRIDHHRGGDHHDDRSFAVGAAALHLSQSSSAGEWMEIT